MVGRSQKASGDVCGNVQEEIYQKNESGLTVE